ncbi:hypothetical protein CIB48_g8360 [Xylaria polymorpha]|nr:hypothetical protein CIB48_g8360 [Xylaria polymorpha]
MEPVEKRSLYTSDGLKTRRPNCWNLLASDEHPSVPGAWKSGRYTTDNVTGPKAEDWHSLISLSVIPAKGKSPLRLYYLVIRFAVPHHTCHDKTKTEHACDTETRSQSIAVQLGHVVRYDLEVRSRFIAISTDPIIRLNSESSNSIISPAPRLQDRIILDRSTRAEAAYPDVIPISPRLETSRHGKGDTNISNLWSMVMLYATRPKGFGPRTTKRVESLGADAFFIMLGSALQHHAKPRNPLPTEVQTLQQQPGVVWIRISYRHLDSARSDSRLAPIVV